MASVVGNATETDDTASTDNMTMSLSAEMTVDTKVMTDPCAPSVGDIAWGFSTEIQSCGSQSVNTLGLSRRRTDSSQLSPEQEAHSKCPADSFCCFDERFPHCSPPPREIDAGDATDSSTGWTLLLRQLAPIDGEERPGWIL